MNAFVCDIQLNKATSRQLWQSLTKTSVFVQYIDSVGITKDIFVEI